MEVFLKGDLDIPMVDAAGRQAKIITLQTQIICL